MHNIVIARINTNDDSCILLEWLYRNGQMVKQNDILALLETAKATVDVISDGKGILQQLVEPGTECQVGQIVAHLFQDEHEKETFLQQTILTEEPEAPQIVITHVARTLIAEHGITDEQIASLKKQIVQKADIESLLHKKQDNRVLLTKQQQAIATVVSTSHLTIPAAFTVMKIPCDQALQFLQDIQAKHDIILGLPELIIKFLADMRTAFPFFFGELQDAHYFQPAATANIGVTIDIGHGLFIPVLKDVEHMSLLQIADALMDFRIKALRANFRAEDLTGGSIALSLNNENDILFAQPIIMPQQTCMVSLGAVQEEYSMDQHGAIQKRRYICLGIAYDHRIINGRDATQFLKALKEKIEHP